MAKSVSNIFHDVVDFHKKVISGTGGHDISEGFKDMIGRTDKIKAKRAAEAAARDAEALRRGMKTRVALWARRTPRGTVNTKKVGRTRLSNKERLG